MNNNCSLCCWAFINDSKYLPLVVDFHGLCNQHDLQSCSRIRPYEGVHAGTMVLANPILFQLAINLEPSKKIKILYEKFLILD